MRYKRQYFGCILKRLGYPVYYKNVYMSDSDIIDNKLYHVEVENEGSDWHPTRCDITDDLDIDVPEKTSSETCNKEKKVYQLVFYNHDIELFKKEFWDFIWKDSDAVELSSSLFWFVSDLTPTELCDKIKPMVTDENGHRNNFYIMEMSENMNCFMGSRYIDWFRDKMGMKKLKNNGR